MNRLSLSKLPKRWLIPLLIGATTIVGASTFYAVSQFAPNRQEQTEQPPPPPRQVAALGELQPSSEVVKVSTSASLRNDRVAQLLIKRGDRVSKNQIIAVMDSRDQLQDEVRKAKEQVQVAQAKLAQVKAGARRGEIEAQRAEIARLQAELQGEIATQQATIAERQATVKNAQSEYDRFQQLRQAGAISASQFDQKRLALQTAQAQLNATLATRDRTADTLRVQIQQAQANLERIAEIRPTDVQAAQTEVNSAIAVLQRAETDLEKAEIRSPIVGKILDVHARAGEMVGDSGIADLGATDTMQVVAEVYQSDVEKIRVGQNAIVESDSLSGELRGTVFLIEPQVQRQQVTSGTPGENLEQRVVRVRVQLTPESSQRAAALTNLQVKARILLD
ncbi:heterocyst specific ABC-transporter, membrane fusion protein DevB homolog [Leptolyngbya sp. NIES-2104]|nr:heterocyst specific ABC-transporter, membrane fusion protein DevB homolog [Leptolyngbya sp. NIES-2104]